MPQALDIQAYNYSFILYRGTLYKVLSTGMVIFDTELSSAQGLQFLSFLSFHFILHKLNKLIEKTKNACSLNCVAVCSNCHNALIHEERIVEQRTPVSHVVLNWTEDAGCFLMGDVLRPYHG